MRMMIMIMMMMMMTMMVVMNQLSHVAVLMMAMSIVIQL